MSKLLRNRFTLLVLPVVIIYLVYAYALLSFTDADPNTFLNLSFLFLLLFCIIFFSWRIKSPRSFWNFLILIEPHNARFYNNRASAYLRLGDYEHALQDYTTGMQLQPKAKILAFLYNGRLALFSQMGRYAEALQDAEHGLQLKSTKLVSATLLYNRGHCFQLLFAYDAALRDYDYAVRTVQRVASYVHLSRGLIYAAQGNYQSALLEEDACMRKLPGSPLSYNARAIIHLKFRYYQRALEDANLALARCRPAHRLLTRQGGDYPYTANVYAQRALAYRGLGNYQAALIDARKAVELAPVHGPHFYSLGQVYLTTNDIPQARQAFQQGLAVDPKDVSNAVLLTWTNMYATSPTAEQAPFLAEAAQLYPESEWGHLCRGIAAWLCGDVANARTSLAYARTLDVTNPHMYFWLGMLHASVEEDELAYSALWQAVQFDLAPALLMPLRYFEQKRPDFYQSTLRPLLIAK